MNMRQLKTHRKCGLMFTVQNRMIMERVELSVSAYLRCIDESDVTDAYVHGLNDDDVHKYMEIGKGPAQTIESVTAYVREQRVRGDAFLFGFFLHETLRGTCRLHNITATHADIGIALFDKSIWGNGWASRLIAEITEIATINLECSCVNAGIEFANLASKRAFKKAGYVFNRNINQVSDNDLVEVWEFRLPVDVYK